MTSAKLAECLNEGRAKLRAHRKAIDDAKCDDESRKKILDTLVVFTEWENMMHKLGFKIVWEKDHMRIVGLKKISDLA